MKKISVSVFLLIFWIAVAAAADNQPNIRNLETKTVTSVSRPLSTYSEKVEIPPLTPKSISIEIIERDTAITAPAPPLINTKDAVKLPEIINLGDAKDALFFVDTGFAANPERGGSEKIPYSEFTRYFRLISELFNNKIYNEVIRESDYLLNYLLFGDGRIKLLFMKAVSALESDNIQLAQSTLAQIDALDKQKIFAGARIYYYAKSLEKSNNTDGAISEYLKIYKLYPENNYADNALYYAAELFAEKKNDYAAAEKYLDIIIRDYSQSDFADDALFYKAQLFDKTQAIKNYSVAEELYRQLYKIYPKSVYSQEAQERGRFIRKNYL